MNNYNAVIQRKTPVEKAAVFSKKRREAAEGDARVSLRQKMMGFHSGCGKEKLAGFSHSR